MMHNGKSWSEAPKDVLENIFTYLDSIAYARCLCVCRCWLSIGNADGIWKYRVESEFGDPNFQKSCPMVSWKQVFSDVLSSRSALHKANLSIFHQTLLNVTEWAMQIAFVDFKETSDWEHSVSCVMLGEEITMHRRPQSIILKSRLVPAQNCLTSGGCKLWAKHKGVWQLVSCAPPFEGTYITLNAWTWEHETGWCLGKLRPDGAGYLEGEVSVYVHYSEIRDISQVWDVGRRLPEHRLQRLAFPQQPSIPLFCIAIDFSANTKSVKVESLWIEMGWNWGSKAYNGVVKTEIEAEEACKVLTAAKYCPFESADFSIFDGLGHLLIGRSCIEVWQNVENGGIKLGFLEDEPQPGACEINTVQVDLLEGKYTASLELSPSCFEYFLTNIVSHHA